MSNGNQKPAGDEQRVDDSGEKAADTARNGGDLGPGGKARGLSPSCVGWIVVAILAAGAVYAAFAVTSGVRGLIAVFVLLYLVSILVWLLLESRRDKKEQWGDPIRPMVRLAALYGLIGGLVMEVDLLRAFLFGTKKAAHIWSAGDAAWPRVTGGIGLAFVLGLVILATLYAIVGVARDE